MNEWPLKAVSKIQTKRETNSLLFILEDDRIFYQQFVLCLSTKGVISFRESFLGSVFPDKAPDRAKDTSV